MPNYKESDVFDLPYVPGQGLRCDLWFEFVGGDGVRSPDGCPSRYAGGEAPRQQRGVAQTGHVMRHVLQRVEVGWRVVAIGQQRRLVHPGVTWNVNRRNGGHSASSGG